MVGTNIRISKRLGQATILAVAMLLAVSIACASDDSASDDSPATTNQSASIVDSESVVSEKVVAVDTSRETKAHTGPNVLPAEAAETGSDEAAIIDLLDHVVGAMNQEDWGSTLDVCNPDWKSMTADDAKMLNTFFYEGRVDLPGLNYRNVTVKAYKDDTAFTKSDEYEFDELLSEGIQHSWHFAEGT